MARWTQTWLSGPPAGPDDEPPEWPGQHLGLPADGQGAVAGGGSRFGAFLLDLIAASLVTALFLQPDLSSPDAMQTFNNVAVLTWVALTVPAAAFFGFTPGMAATGIRVGRLDGARSVGLWRAVVRCALTALLIPTAVRNVDGRGWQDRATGTVVVRMR